jgi:hypothetical protein
VVSATRVSLLTLLLAWAGCITPPARGYPLYQTANPLAAERVATLYGYIARVDGRDVASLGAVEVLPGCHLVETPAKWSGGGGSYGVTVATTGPLTFALSMTAGHRYEVKVETDPMTSGPAGTAYILAEETTMTGAPVRRIGPAKSRAEVDACLHGS